MTKISEDTNNQPTPMQKAEEHLRFLAGLKKTLQQYCKQKALPSNLIKSIHENYKNKLNDIAEIPLSENDRSRINQIIVYHQRIEQELQKGDPVVDLLTKIKDALNSSTAYGISAQDRERLGKLFNKLDEEMRKTEINKEINEEKCNELINYHMNKLSWPADVQIRSAMRSIQAHSLDVPQGNVMGNMIGILSGKNRSKEEVRISVSFAKAREESTLYKLACTPIPPINPIEIKDNLNDLKEKIEEVIHADKKLQQ